MGDSMKIPLYPISKGDYDYFKTLSNIDKIRYLYHILIIEPQEESNKKEENSSDIVIDSEHHPLYYVNVQFTNTHVIVKSAEQKFIRPVITKFFEDGMILKKIKNKIIENKKEKMWYEIYEIVSFGDPICLS